MASRALPKNWLRQDLIITAAAMAQILATAATVIGGLVINGSVLPVANLVWPIVWFATRIYDRGLLRTGKPLKWREALTATS